MLETSILGKASAEIRRQEPVQCFLGALVREEGNSTRWNCKAKSMCGIGHDKGLRFFSGCSGKPVEGLS